MKRFNVSGCQKMVSETKCYLSTTIEQGHELAKDPLPQRRGGGIVHYDFLKQYYIKNKMTHVSPLYVGVLTCNVNVNYTTQNYMFILR